jgi:hypothetical protein
VTVGRNVRLRPKRICIGEVGRVLEDLQSKVIEQEMSRRHHSDIWYMTDVVPVLKPVTKKRIRKHCEGTAIIDIYCLTTTSKNRFEDIILCAIINVIFRVF